MPNQTNKYRYIESGVQPPPIPTDFVDGKNESIAVGDSVLFYMQGAIRRGKISSIYCKWKEAYHKGSGQWYADFKIEVEVTGDEQKDYPVGHVSTLTSFDILWRID